MLPASLASGAGLVTARASLVPGVAGGGARDTSALRSKARTKPCKCAAVRPDQL